MYTRSSFIEDFEKLLEKYSKDASFPELQHASRQLSLLTATKVLAKFAKSLSGPLPKEFQMQGSNQPSAAGGPHMGPGPYPNTYCAILCAISELQQSQQPGGGT